MRSSAADISTHDQRAAVLTPHESNPGLARELSASTETPGAPGRSSPDPSASPFPPQPSAGQICIIVRLISFDRLPDKSLKGMHVHVIQDPDQAPLDPLLNRTIAVLGYGNQGRAHALNLRDSGLRVIVGNRLGRPRAEQAQTEGFAVHSIADAAEQADLAIMALPDEVQPDVYASSIAGHLRPGTTLGFIHGFSIHYRLIEPSPESAVVMVAPKGPGTTLRELYTRGRGLPALLAIEQDGPNSDGRALALAWAAGIGSARAGIIETTFAGETETDLFGEQAVLCGGIGRLILAAFETLVDAGYPPELAYIECCHEVKQVADLVYREGLAGMYERISNTAAFGAHVAGPRVIDSHVRRQMSDVLADIRNGTFARSLRDDAQAEFEWFRNQQEQAASHPIEEAGRSVRALMPWLAEGHSSRSPGAQSSTQAGS